MLRLDITMSLDGFVAGPDQSLDEPLGVGGESLHEWMFVLKSWREEHGEEGGEVNASNEVLAKRTENVGSYLMGRKMFGGGPGPWNTDEEWRGWWGENPPYHVPVFVLTHHEREPLEMEGGTTFHFVTDGIDSALDRAREAAGDKDILLAGGADVARQYMRAGKVDEIQVHVSPRLLGSGERLFDDLGDLKLEQVRAIEAPGVTHLTYRPG
jgi:dihydrofolate reductase